jgi:DNA polymerase
MDVQIEPQRARLPSILKDPFLHGCKTSQCGMFSTNKPVRPRGNWEARALWTGEAPGLQEERQNCTFVGPAGNLAAEVLESIGLPIDKNFLVVNSCQCRPYPPAGSTKQNRTPNKDEIKACRPYLERIVELHKPDIIVIVGGKAAESIMESAPPISKIVGKFFGPEQHDFPIDADLYAIWHPAYILRNMREKEEWTKHLIRLRDYMLGRKIVIR